MTATMPETSPLIADLNDRFRREVLLLGSCRTVRGEWGATVALAEKPWFARAVSQTARFFDFTHDNDPRGEHDFGAFSVEGERVFFKIDYYSDSACTFGSDDPADPDRTYRVLTIMLASDY